jgi:hypothetical protein
MTIMRLPFRIIFSCASTPVNECKIVIQRSFLGGVTRRFPELRFAFLEGGVGWASQRVAKEAAAIIATAIFASLHRDDGAQRLQAVGDALQRDRDREEERIPIAGHEPARARDNAGGLVSTDLLDRPGPVTVRSKPQPSLPPNNDGIAAAGSRGRQH